MSTTYEKIKKIITEILEFDADKVTPEADLTDGIGFDSLDKVDLMMGIEEEFEIEIPDKDIPSIRTMKDLVEYVDARKK